MLAFALFVLCVTLPAYGQAGEDDAIPATTPQVTAKQKQEAMKLFEQAVAQHQRSLYKSAAETYKEALTHWEHPLIRYYLSRVLDELRDPVAAYENLRAALSGLDKDELDQARKLEKRLLGQLAQIAINIETPGARIELSGEDFVPSPDVQSQLRTPGHYVIVARKPDHFTITAPVALVPGKRTVVTVELTRDEPIVKRRWKSWQPWAVAGTGLVLGTIGTVLRSRAVAHFADYDRELSSRCGDADTCDAITASSVADIRQTGEWENRLAVGAFISGGFALTAGLVMMYFNRPRVHRSESTQKPRIEFAPLLSSDGTGGSMRFSF